MKGNDNFHSPKAAKFYKFAINNNKGRQVQVIAWNDNIKILKVVQSMGTVSNLYMNFQLTIYIGIILMHKIYGRSYRIDEGCIYQKSSF